MNSFEAAIKGQQSASDEYRWPGMTIGHLIGAVLSIHDVVTAQQFRNGYIEWLSKQPDLGRSAETVADANIGWCFGEGMPESDRAIWRELGSRHPVFGEMVNDPLPVEVFRAGMEIGGKP